MKLEETKHGLCFPNLPSGRYRTLLCQGNFSVVGKKTIRYHAWCARTCDSYSSANNNTAAAAANVTFPCDFQNQTYFLILLRTHYRFQISVTEFVFKMCKPAHINVCKERWKAG